MSAPSGSDGAASEPLTLRLRRETAAAHERLETDLDLLADPSPARLRGVLGRFLGFHRTWEAAVAPLIASETGDDPAWFVPRRRTDALEHDLALLHVAPAEIAALPAPPVLPWLADADAAWGSLYVMEGSTLGGQVIARALREHGVEGLLYFDGRGREAGPMWRDLRTRLDARTGDATRVVAGADAAFEALREWMTEESR